MSIAQRVRRERRAELDRVRALNTTTAQGPDGEDHGLDLGPAALARARGVIRVGGTIKGAAQQKAAPVNAVKVADATMFDRMHRVCQLNDRQHSAGLRLHKLWVASGLEPQTTARYPVLPSLGEREFDQDGLDDLELEDGETPLDQHRRVMRLLPGHVASLLDSACMWVPGRPSAHPGVKWLACFQAGLDLLADYWEIAREGL